MRYRAIIFDLDGTLLDTLADLANAMNAALKSLGLPTHPQEAYNYFVGDGMGELAVRVLPEGRRDKTSVAQCLDAMRKEYTLRRAHTTTPYKNIKPLLTALTKARIAMAVLSNKPHELTVAMIARFFPRVRFSAVEGHRENRPRKPDPAAALEIAQKIGIRPAEFIYLGDTDTDMQTARAAGMKPVGALWGFRTKEELIKSGAEIVINNPLDILKMLNRTS